MVFAAVNSKETLSQARGKVRTNLCTYCGMRVPSTQIHTKTKPERAGCDGRGGKIPVSSKSAERVPGPPGTHGKTVSQKTKTHKQIKEGKTGRREDGELLFNGTEIPFRKMKTDHWQMLTGGACRTFGRFPQTRHLKWLGW